MCRALADGLTDRHTGYTGSVTSTKLKVSGIDVFSAGDFSGGDGAEDIVLRDASRGVYKRVVIKDDRIVGAVLYGDTADGGWYFDLMKRREDIAPVRDMLIFGQAFARGGGAGDPSAAVAALSDDAEICGCNGVSKATVCKAIVDGAVSLDAVRSTCKASASCGSCTNVVERLLSIALGADYGGSARPRRSASAPASAMTTCAARSSRRPCVRSRGDAEAALVDARRLLRLPARAELLSAVRGARRICRRPAEPLRQRAHARHIQKDGTYSVVPRMWGGLTTPKELRAIADVVDKFNAPMVKVTGGQRPRHIRDQEGGPARGLGGPECRGMVSGHAYGKSLRTVKTCVGSDWCRSERGIRPDWGSRRSR